MAYTVKTIVGAYIPNSRLIDTFWLSRDTSSMKEQIVHEKAERIRDVLRYVRKFKNTTVIIYIDDEIIDSRLFTSHIRDICLIHETGLNVILVPGARKRINEVLSSAGIKWSYHDNCRITNEEAMPLIKMAAFDVSNKVMTALAAEKKTAVIGNWVRSRGKGIVNGFDYGTIGLSSLPIRLRFTYKQINFFSSFLG